jgi:DNA polymerase sigma
MSTEFMKSWLEIIPNLNPILIVLKYLMSTKGLNRPFKGGLSSYCLMIMVTAYLKESIQHYKLAGKPQKSIGEQFIEVLNFYCGEFDNENTSLSLIANQSCFFKTGDEKHYLNIIDPLNFRMMTVNCS